MSARAGNGGVDRLRVFATRLAGRIGGVPAVRTVAAVLEAYDRAGGGLVAGGLAYSALIALLPGLLLALSVFGLVIDDPAVREELVATIANAVPPLEEFARTALEQVSAGAVPGGIIAAIGLLWASSRFYSALDDAIGRVFRHARRRNEIERSVRGLLVSTLLVALPIAVVVAGAVASWLLDFAPEGVEAERLVASGWQLASPVASALLFIVATVLVYRFVPAERVPASAWRRPALVVGLLLAGFTQLFAFLAPLMLRIASLYGAVVAVFALLAWLSIGFNMVLIGAAWTHVRSKDGSASDGTIATSGTTAGSGSAPGETAGTGPGEVEAGR